MKKTLTAIMLAAALLAGCSTGDKPAETTPPAQDTTPPATTAGSEAKTYTAESKPDDHGSSSALSITYEGDKITAVDWKEFSNGELKDENYGKDAGEDNYKGAQDALKGSETYGTQLLEKQDINKVDAVSGATNSYDSFKELYEEIQKQR